MTDQNLVTRLHQSDEPTALDDPRCPAPRFEPRDELRSAREEVDQLKIAVEHRTITAQATGIVMERFGLDAATAFGVLATLSQHTNRKLFHIARELVTEGDVAGLRDLVVEVTQDSPGEE